MLKLKQLQNKSLRKYKTLYEGFFCFVLFFKGIDCSASHIDVLNSHCLIHITQFK